MRCGVYVRVSTDDQRDNGYSIDSQLRMIKEYCEKNEYDIIDVYNDAGHSGKDLMRPEMQRLLTPPQNGRYCRFLITMILPRAAAFVCRGSFSFYHCKKQEHMLHFLSPYDMLWMYYKTDSEGFLCRRKQP